MSKYNTKQRAVIIDYLKDHEGQHASVNEILEHFNKLNVPIGLTTIYRQLENLVSEGIAHKYVLDTGSGATFEYAGHEQDDEEMQALYHLKCEDCGKLIHLDCNTLQDVEGHIEKDHGFKINPVKTVLYGICQDCSPKHEK